MSLSLKADHLKRRADDDARAGRYADACARYEKALQAGLGMQDRVKAHANRSLALERAGRSEEALVEAEKALEADPSFAKALWRKGRALEALGKHATALTAYSNGAAKSAGKDRRAWWTRSLQCARRMTRVEAAEWLSEEVTHRLGWLSECEPSALARAFEQHIERFTEKRREIDDEYKEFVAKWSFAGMSRGMASLQRSLALVQAKLFRCALLDAQFAVKAYRGDQGLRKSERLGTGDGMSLDPLAWSFFAEGKAYEAEEDHPNHEPFKSLKAFTRAVDLQPDSNDFQASMSNASFKVGAVWASKAMSEVRNSADVESGALLPSLSASNEAIRVHAAAKFPRATVRDFNAASRNVFRHCLAESLSLPSSQVHIAGVAADREDKALGVEFQVYTDSQRAADSVEEALGRDLREVISSNLVNRIGPPNASPLRPAERLSVFSTSWADEPQDDERSFLESHEESWCSEIQVREEMPLGLRQGKGYKLVRSDGRPASVGRRHPFGLARVCYKGTEKPTETWVEPEDGSCRWRQTASEVEVRALRVPPDAQAREITVQIERRRVHVAARGEVVLDGRLEGPIVPRESTWEKPEREEAILHLAKMNLELLEHPWDHHATWWRRLLEGQAEVAHGDVERDFSDLPPEAAERHRSEEARREAERQRERPESAHRRSADERDFARKRRRASRLSQLRGDPF